jgi:hypothetical protein
MPKSSTSYLLGDRRHQVRLRKILSARWKSGTSSTSTRIERSPATMRAVKQAEE